MNPLCRLPGIFALVLVLAGAGCSTVPRTSADPLAAPRVELREAQRKNSPALYLDTARQSLTVATSDGVAPATRAAATALYNTAVAHAVAALDAQPVPGYALTFSPPRGVTRFLVAEDIPRKHMKTDVRRAGFGGALVGVMDDPATASPNRPPKGYAEPWTAIAEFGPIVAGRTPVTIRLLDPRAESQVRFAGADRPLAGDFTAPFAYYPHVNELIFGFVSMMRSDLTEERSGLRFYEPYDPKKIPVLFVHGLMSSPHAWLQVVNQLNADPDFRRRYQVWSYFYPTGGPIAGNALSFRDSLAAVAKIYPLRDNLVLVGHSMGGILSRMQVTNTGRVLWDAVFRTKADEIYAQLPADALFKRALIFKANPHVDRVVFFSTPHRGSRLAKLRAAGLLGNLVRMPVSLVKGAARESFDLLRQVDPAYHTVPNSIQGLSPDNVLLKALADLPMTVPFDTIVGDRGRPGPLAESSDGVVPYWSAHVPGAQSELVVPTGHDSFNHPNAIANLRRILALQAAAGDN